MASARKYVYTGAIMLAVSGAAAIYLNFQSYKCLNDLRTADRSIIMPGQLEEMDRNCSITTNSYVYSVYAVVVGIIVLMAGFVKKRKGN